MEQIPWGVDLSRPPPIVPYLCEDIPDAICNDIEHFGDWPALKKWDLSLNTPIVIAAARCQAWLFFGLLNILTTMNGGRFNLNDFIATRDDRKIVYSAGVQSLLLEVSEKIFPIPQPKKDDAHTRNAKRLFEQLKALLPETVTWIIKIVQKHEESNFGCDVWNFEAYNVFLSIFLLLEGVCDIAIERHTVHITDASCHCTPWIRVFAYCTRTLDESFQRMGHCVSLCRRVSLSLKTACQALAISAEENFNHSTCDRDRCRSYNVNCESYVPQHTKDCDRCSLVRIDTDALHSIIRMGSIPVIRSKQTSVGELTIDVIDESEAPDFAAISHLWAGGLGNMKENAHYHCQLKQIHADLLKLHPSILPYKTSVTTTYYWLDSLCIPVQCQILKIQAINSMAQIYAGSNVVLVIDPFLHNQSTINMSMQQLDLAVLCSPWMARSWTLQEGALAVNIVFRFSDRLVSLEQLKFVGGRTQQTSVQSLWSRDVNRIMPRKYNDLAISHHLSHAFGSASRSTHSHQMLVRYLLSAEPRLSSRVNFLQIWNQLSARTTSESADIPAILGVLMGLSASEVLELPEHQRMQALIRSQNILPTGLLFAPIDLKSATWSPLPPMAGPNNHPLRYTDDLMKFLPSGILKIDRSDSVYVFRSSQPVSLLQEVCIYIPASTLYFRIRFDGFGNGDTRLPSQEIVLMFDKISRGNSRSSNGACFALTKATEKGLHLSYIRPFTYEYLGRSSVSNHLKRQSRYHILDFYEVNDISSGCPLFIDMRVDWPRLEWSRSEFYPFTGISRQVASWLHLFDSVFLVVICQTISMAYSQFFWAFDKSGYSSTVLMGPIATFMFLALHKYLLDMEYEYVQKAVSQHLQRRWAASFSMQKDTSEPDLDPPQYKLMATFYALLLVSTYVPTMMMFVYLPAVQAAWSRGFHWSMVWQVFREYVLDVQSDGSQRQWHSFIARHACRTICVELLTRIMVLGMISLKDSFDTSSTTKDSEDETQDRYMAAFNDRFGPMKLFYNLIYLPGMISFVALAWTANILSGSIRGDWTWKKIFTYCSLIWGTVNLIQQVVKEYGPSVTKLVVRVKDTFLAITAHFSLVVSPTSNRKTASEIELISIQ